MGQRNRIRMRVEACPRGATIVDWYRTVPDRSEFARKRFAATASAIRHLFDLETATER
jgi:hypothetical protein